MHRFFGITLMVLLLSAVGSAARAPKQVRVSIDEMKFNPSSLDIKPGDTVRWTNDDERDHTVAASDGSFKSGNLRSGDSFEYTFKKAGKFSYACSYHPRMKGTVNVKE
jgi:plastocyanin